jgi:hypothetical protein
MKQLVITVLFLCTMQTLQAQMNGLYFKAGAGYAFALGAQLSDNTGVPYAGSITYMKYNYPTITSYDATKVSFASGAQVYLTAGYMVNNHIGIELHTNIMPAPATNDVYMYNAYNPAGSDVMNAHITRQLSMPFLITPSLLYSTGGNKAFSYYARGGVVLPVYVKMTEDDQYYNPLTGADEDVKKETKMKFGIGFSGAMGLRYSFSPQLSVWGECSIMALSLYPNETTITEHTVNGDPANPKLFPIVGSVIKYNTTGAYSTTTLPAYALPFSNVGFNVGVMYFINKEKASQSVRRK